MKKKILIVEDDMNILALEKDYLESNSFVVETAADGKTGLEMALNEDYDLILLDIMLPGESGLEICHKVRSVKDIPILLVSAKKDDLDKIRGLGFGADDYIVKPFSPSELVARVIAHISRYQRLTARDEKKTDEAEILEIDKLRLDGKSRRAYIDGKEIVLTNKEYDLLHFLASSPDTVFSKETLANEIWQYDSIGATSTVTVHVNRIRDKIKEVNGDLDYVYTVWGKGYRFNK